MDLNKLVLPVDLTIAKGRVSLPLAFFTLVVPLGLDSDFNRVRRGCNQSNLSSKISPQN